MRFGAENRTLINLFGLGRMVKPCFGRSLHWTPQLDTLTDTPTDTTTRTTNDPSQKAPKQIPPPTDSLHCQRNLPIDNIIDLLSARTYLHTLFRNESITDINYPELFSLFHIDTWWGQSKYVRKFEISQANFEKTQNLFILKIFLWILCINMQNCSISKELRHKSFENLQTISKLVQEPLN